MSVLAQSIRLDPGEMLKSPIIAVLVRSRIFQSLMEIVLSEVFKSSTNSAIGRPTCGDGSGNSSFITISLKMPSYGFV